MYIDATDDAGVSINSFLSTIKAVGSAIKGHVRIANRTDATQFLLFQITDLTVQNTDQWWVIDITNQASSTNSPFTNTEDIIVSFLVTGDAGQKGETRTYRYSRYRRCTRNNWNTRYYRYSGYKLVK